MQNRASPIWRDFFLGVSAVAAAALMLRFSGAFAEGVREGMLLSIATLIPSLFPFMVLCTFLTRTPAIEALSRPLAPLFFRLFHLPRVTAGPFLLSLAGGYPVGARMLRSLCDDGLLSPDDIGALLPSFVHGGPAFFISGVGIAMMGSSSAGLLLFTAQLLASLLTALLFRPKAVPGGFRAARVGSYPPALAAFVSAVRGAASALLTVSAFVILFGGITAALAASGLTGRLAQGAGALFHMPPALFQALWRSVFEVSAGCRAAADLGGGAALVVASVACSFSGLCIMFQVAATFSGQSVRYGRLVLSRLTHAALSAPICLALMRAFPASVPVFQSGDSPVPAGLSAAPPAALTGLLFALCLLVSLEKRAGNSRPDLL